MDKETLVNNLKEAGFIQTRNWSNESSYQNMQMIMILLRYISQIMQDIALSTTRSQDSVKQLY